ncbi:hypothetical protein DFH28DRAFT_1106353 [Melampsora americana]|nr:hypothetical protein DFH28DRAFT_1106353 [Melampsora americana]
MISSQLLILLVAVKKEMELVKIAAKSKIQGEQLGSPQYVASDSSDSEDNSDIGVIEPSLSDSRSRSQKDKSTNWPALGQGHNSLWNLWLPTTIKQSNHETSSEDKPTNKQSKISHVKRENTQPIASSSQNATGPSGQDENSKQSICKIEDSTSALLETGFKPASCIPSLCSTINNTNALNTLTSKFKSVTSAIHKSCLKPKIARSQIQIPPPETSNQRVSFNQSHSNNPYLNNKEERQKSNSSKRSAQDNMYPAQFYPDDVEDPANQINFPTSSPLPFTISKSCSALNGTSEKRQNS